MAEQTRRHAKGEADAIFMKMEAQAKGIFEILSKQATGFEMLVNAAGKDPQKAVMMMIADKLPELVKTQVEAVKNLKIDKVTVWDSMSAGKDGRGSSTANYFSSMLAAIPPLKDLFNQAGLELPDFLSGTKKKEEHPVNPIANAPVINIKEDNNAGIQAGKTEKKSK
jgi:flotillin